MPAPFDYSVQRPDIMGAIGAYEAGRDRNRQVMQQNKQDMFAQYLPGALKGDQQALQGAQQNATPEQQMQLQNALAQMEDRQLQQTLQQQEKFSRLAQWADTPEKWAQATQMAEAEGMQGASQVPFEQRGAKLAGMLSVKDQLDQEWKRREFQLQERNVNSQIGARNAAAQSGGAAGGGRAPSGYEWIRGASGALELAPIKGGPADPAKLQPGELSKIRGSNKQIDELENSLNSYITNLGKTSPVGRLIDRGAAVSKVETGHTDLLMQMKNLYELGVLNGPDYRLMTKIVEDPTGLMQVWRGNEGLTAQTDTVKSIITRARNLNNDRLQQAGVDAYRNPQQSTGAGSTGDASSIPRVTTQAQFDALPSGAVYMEEDGNRYTKP